MLNQVSITRDDLKKLEFCLFTLNYLACHADELDDIADGLGSIVNTAAEKLEALCPAVYGGHYAAAEASLKRV